MPRWGSHYLGDSPLAGVGVVIDAQRGAETGSGPHGTLGLLEPRLVFHPASPRKAHLISLNPGQLQEKH